MKNKKISSMLLVLVLALLLIPGASAWSGYLNNFETAYPAAVGSRIDKCGVCHINPNSGGARNVYGSDFAANSYNFAAIESKDSDGDGFINKDEIDALTFPGDINDKPAIAPVLTTVTISPLTPNVQVPYTLEFRANALDQNNAAIGATLTWSSSDTTKGTVNSTTGVFKAVASGTTTITVTAVNGSTTVTNSTIVTVLAPAQLPVLTTVTISPLTPTVQTPNTLQFSAAALDQNKATIGAALTWSSSDLANGTINSTTGLFKAVASGTTTITVTAVNGSTTVTNSTIVTVLAPAQLPVLTTVTISPLTPTVQTPNTLQFSAAALDQNKATIGAALTWSSSDLANGTINSTTGLFTAVAPGTTTITVTAVNGSTTVTNSTKVTVTEPNQNSEVKTINVSPPKAKIVVGKSQTFIATAFDQFKQAISAIFTWKSSNTTVGTIDNAGKFTALSAGTTTITATNGTISGSANVEVIAPSSEEDEHDGDEIDEDEHDGDEIDEDEHDGDEIDEDEHDEEHEIEEEIDED